MACNSVSGITFQCLQNLGGISEIYIANFESVSATTSNGIGVITDIDMTGSTKFERFQFETRVGTSTFSEEATVTLEAGSTFYTQTTTLVIPRKDSEKRNKLLSRVSMRGFSKNSCIRSGFLTMVVKWQRGRLTATRMQSKSLTIRARA